MASTTAHAAPPEESPKAHIPTINLLCRLEGDSDAFRKAVKKYFPRLYDITKVTIYNCSMAKLPPEVRYDAIVSPANSYGFMDGAFDEAITVALSPNTEEGYGWTTHKVQTSLYQKTRGYAPPGTCTMIDVRKDSAWYDIKRAEKKKEPSEKAPEENQEHRGGCKYIALCPTMRVPRQVKWDREVIFECIWSLLCALDVHNREVQDPELQIKSILMTPLATGVGKVSATKWAAQCVIAMKYWVEAVENPDKWSHLSWCGRFTMNHLR